MNMENKYIGIKKGGSNRFESSNLNMIFTRQDNGTYIGQSLTGKIIVLTEEEIKHDLELNYLVPYGK